jgi:hypothetical protein
MVSAFVPALSGFGLLLLGVMLACMAVLLLKRKTPEAM